MGSSTESFKFNKKIVVQMWEKSYGRLDLITFPKFATMICSRRMGLIEIRFDEGLKQAELMFGVDFTKSNEQTGRISFKGKSLHLNREGILNPYQHMMTVFARIFPFLLDKNLLQIWRWYALHLFDTSGFSCFV
ncbi:hypothetical protein C5167_027086 [Papaver somniferum]|nr:hypothetical protein C5167_027086 [Papaver somniferum]